MKEFVEFLEKLDNEMGKPIIDKWVRNLKILSYDACNLYLEAQDPLQMSWFEEQIRPILKTEFLNANHHPIKVHLHLPGQTPKIKKPFFNKTSEDISFNIPPLDPLMTLYTYLSQDSNKMTFKLLSELVGFDKDSKSFQTPKMPLGQMNPILIYGPKGSGKTHLIVALAAALKKLEKNVIYIPCEVFCSHVIQAMRFGHIDSFRKIYREADVLLVDDIQGLANKTATQEEFFHTFNHLHQRGKQILLTSEETPQTLKNIEERLISRFVWGITLPLNKLDSSQFYSLITQKSLEFHLAFTEEAKKYLTESFSSLDDVQKALETCLYQKQLNPSIETINEGHVREWTSAIVQAKMKKTLTPEIILKAVSEFFKITEEKILSDDQTQEIARTRQIAMFLIKRKLNLPYLTLGKIFNRNHSTVMSSIELISNRIANKEIPIIQALDHIEKLLSDYTLS